MRRVSRRRCVSEDGQASEMIVVDDTGDSEGTIPAKSPAYVCNVCSQSFPADQVYDTVGVYTYRACYAKQAAAESGHGHPAAGAPTQAASPAAHPPDAVPRQITLRASITC